MIRRLQDEQGTPMELKKVDADTAAVLLEQHNTYVGQRPLKSAVIKRYAGILKAGKWIRPSVVAMMRGPAQVWHIADGQQRLSAIVKAGLPMPLYFEHWECDTEMELVELYATFNVDAGRTANNLISSMRHMYPPPLDGYPVAFLSNCASAAAYTRGGRLGFGQLEDDKKDAKARFLHSCVPQVKWLHSLYVEACPERSDIMNLNAMTAMLLTWHANAGLASEFWKPVCSGENLLRGTAQHVLANKIMDKELFGKASSGESGRVTNYVRFCAEVWNRWLGGKPVRGMRVARTGPVPELLRSRS